MKDCNRHRGVEIAYDPLYTGMECPLCRLEQAGENLVVDLNGVDLNQLADAVSDIVEARVQVDEDDIRQAIESTIARMKPRCAA